eukprot:907050_1
MNVVPWFHILVIWTLSPCHSCEIRYGHLAQTTTSSSGMETLHGLNTAITDFNTQSMNDYSTLFPHLVSHNCTLSMHVLETSSSTKLTITQGLSMALNFNSFNLTVPILFGMQFSSLSSLLSPMLEAFDLLHLSGSASSTFLSEYPNFYRSIADDAMQSLSLIKFCKQMNWEKVGVVHMSSSYGNSMARALTQWGISLNVSIESFSFVENDAITIGDVAESMTSSDLYLFILVIYPSDWIILTQQLSDNEMIGYPYYYIGTDAVFFSGVFESYSILNTSFDGMVGTCPWSVEDLSNSDDLSYSYPINESIQQYNQIHSRYAEISSQNITMSRYAYDNVLTILHATNRYIQLHGYEVDNISMFNRSTRFANILQSISFIGLTGNVSFDANGNRQNGLISYCNYAHNKISKIGYFDGEDVIMNADKIAWPASFVLADTIPPRDRYEDASRSIQSLSSLKIALFILAGIVSLILLIYIVFKLVRACKDFLHNFNSDQIETAANANPNSQLLYKEKRRLFISIVSDIVSAAMSLIDYVTDILSLVAILKAKDNVYAQSYVVTYFTISVIASFVFTAHFSVTLQNIVSSYFQLKSGMIDDVGILLGLGVPDKDRMVSSFSIKPKQTNTQPKRVKRKRKRSTMIVSTQSTKKQSVLTTTYNQMHFRSNMLQRLIKQEACTIFVAFFEDLPFFVLNFYAIIKAEITLIILLSLMFNAMSFGYKMAVAKGFFVNLQELGFLKENLTNIVQHKQTIEEEEPEDKPLNAKKKKKKVKLQSSIVPVYTPMNVENINVL